MIIMRFLRWVRGWVLFDIRDENSGKFLSLAGKGLWNIQKEKEKMTAYCRAKDYPTIARMARKCRCQTKVLQRAGVPFWIKRYRFRVGLLVSLAAILIVLGISTLFVWSIDINGNYVLTDAQILEAADSYGLHEGALRSSFDPREIEYELQKTFPEIAWISINRSATHYDIEISEATAKPEIDNDETPANIVSSSDAVIRSVEAYRGVPMVEVGDVVTANQLLVSGTKDFEGSDVIYYTQSKAKIIGEVEKTLCYSKPLYTTVQKKTGETKVKRKLQVLGLEIPLYFQETPDEMANSKTKTTQLSIFGFELPIYMETTTYEIMEEMPVEGDSDALRRVLAQEAKDDELTQFPNSKILQRKYSYETTGDSMTLHATYVVEQEIGVLQPIVAQIDE